MSSNNIQPLRPFMEFILENRQLTKEAYDFLYGMFIRVGGSLSNLNAATLQNGTWQEPGTIGSVTPSTGKFTTLTSTSDTTVGAQLKLPNAGSGIQIKGGAANCRKGSALLSAGTVTVANTSITANTAIFLSNGLAGGTPGFLRYTKVVGTSFTIISSSGADTSTIEWVMVEQL